MHRRQFITGTSVILAASGLALGGCTTTSLSSGESAEDYAQKRNTINAGIDATLTRLQNSVHGSQEVLSKARGVLVFPSVFAAGFWFGGQYGQGGLRVDGQTTGYYSTVAGSFGLQIGAQSKAIVFAFLTQQALDKFEQSQGWAAGADATVALAKVGANGNLDTSTAMSPVVAFVLTNAGLMAGISLEGTKISRLII
ncbi:BPSL1445 family SYLF domain-containing lipoprotein [Paraburkholderia sp.]|jgi:lipid-binding SYLF domain-containing protein|uniref:BPSL1445 family SYLF domain-containing lipoprotein n=1 Tax=Paraburkholderia sp. TaxID=1926495 RepID=UPI002F42D3E7